MQWSPEWAAGFQANAFATMLCPGWMMGPIESYSEGVQGWDVANVFPGGGGNWGGSFLTVPSAGAYTEEAKELAAWLTAPEQQTQAFTTAGAFPSQIEAQGSEAVQAYTNPFFNNAPVGKIFTATGAVHRRRAVQGPVLLRHPRRGQQRPDRGRHRQQRPGDRLEPGRADRRGLPAEAMRQAVFARCLS